MKYSFQFVIHIKEYIMAVSLDKNVKLSKDNLKVKAMQRAIEQDLDKGISATYYKIINCKIYRKRNNKLEPTGIGFA